MQLLNGRTEIWPAMSERDLTSSILWQGPSGLMAARLQKMTPRAAFYQQFDMGRPRLA